MVRQGGQLRFPHTWEGLQPEFDSDFCGEGRVGEISLSSLEEAPPGAGVLGDQVLTDQDAEAESSGEDAPVASVAPRSAPALLAVPDLGRFLDPFPTQRLAEHSSGAPSASAAMATQSRRRVRGESSRWLRASRAAMPSALRR
ncbi:MAG: hypothetical protein M0027_00940 [Candidatus Dormibacteraeota bacterium]|jgi:hypothetical protein|nr:hypothetical protein [Candidatus Dormibacteraeota bacterium]